jgi:hypothetical protein
MIALYYSMREKGSSFKSDKKIIPTVINDKPLLLKIRSIEGIPLCVKEKMTTMRQIGFKPATQDRRLT